MRRDQGLTFFDGLLVASLLAIVGLVWLPSLRVGEVLAAEDRAVDFTRELASRVDEYRADARRDLDDDGIGETPRIVDVIVPTGDAHPSPGGISIQRDGYWFTVLGAGRDSMPIEPVDEARLARLSATTYVILAWPVEPGVSGMRAYMRTPHSGLLRHAIDGYPYGDGDRPPPLRAPLIEVRGGTPRPLPLASDLWVAPRETVKQQ
jgi:hypothetical protein